MKSTPQNERQPEKHFANSFTRFLIFFFSFLAVNGLLLWEKEPFQIEGTFKIGEPAPRSVFAPFGFSYLNDLETEKKKSQAGSLVLPVFDVDRKKTGEILELLDSFFGELSAKKLVPNPSISWESSFVDLSEEDIQEIAEGEEQGRLREYLRGRLRAVLEKGILDFSKKLELINEGKTQIAVRALNNKESTIPLRLIPSVTDAVETMEKQLGERFAKDRKLKNAAGNLIREILRPNFSYDEQEWHSRQRKVTQETGAVYEEIKEGEVIVTKGTLVTRAIMKRLEEVEKKGIKRKFRMQTLGMTLVTFAAFVVLASFLYYFERKEYENWKMLVLIHTVLIVALLIEKLILSIPSGLEEYLLPASVVPIILGLLIRPRIGVIGAILIGVFNFLLTRFNPEVLLYSVLGSMVGAYLTFGLRKRVQFLRVGAVIGLMNFASIFGYRILTEITLPESFHWAVLGLGNGLFAIALCFILLPIFENVFGLLTDITLLELCDLNHPLLRRMVVEAPGTYHHSLVVATLAESSCEAIGANGLLARVGGYFHDIGKIEKAEYFTENQRLGGQDHHEKLSPSMSSLIIASHVKDGVELARRYKLKDQIIDFIPQHQGTCPVYYFYKKAEATAEEGERIDKDNFRYTGPKPQAKETAVVLLADSIEAASRSLADLSPAGIAEMVKSVINEKFIDGQLDECDLTFEDLRRIQESFIHSLIGISHTRVEYPKSDAEPIWQKAVNRKDQSSTP